MAGRGRRNRQRRHGCGGEVKRCLRYLVDAVAITVGVIFTVACLWLGLQIGVGQ